MEDGLMPHGLLRSRLHPCTKCLACEAAMPIVQVTADASLAHALQVHPLVLTVYKQGSIVNSRSSGKTAVTTAAAAVPIGSAEVDLSPLLATR